MGSNHSQSYYLITSSLSATEISLNHDDLRQYFKDIGVVEDNLERYGENLFPDEKKGIHCRLSILLRKKVTKWGED